jgi:cobalt-zinc-cadmium resistance protein CzcA
VSAINEIVETAVGGKVATTVVEGQRRFAVLVRFPEKSRANVEVLSRILVPAPGGERVPLSLVADIRPVEAPAQISREHGARRVVVECNVRGRDVGSFVAEAQRMIEPIVSELPSGYYVRYGGQFENQERAMRRLSVVVPVSILLIFLLLFSAFRSVRNALLVLANLPFAVVGGVLIVYFLAIPLSVPATIGFIALFGVAVQDGTVLVSFFERLRREGLSVEEAVRRGCELRFPSVVVTSLTTVLGLLPMLVAVGAGSEIQAPLATVVVGGLTSALALVLLVLPALYCVVEGRATRVRGPHPEPDGRLEI